jgi:ABC-type glycerol-3-phosphate transport system substrate-binding protein
VEGGKGNEYVEHWANVYGVLKSTQHPEAVATYLRYITSQKVGAQIAELGTPVPLIGAPVPPALENQYEILKTFQTIPARAGLNTEIPNYMERVFNACDDRFFKMEIGPEEFINCLKTEGTTFWTAQS